MKHSEFQEIHHWLCGLSEYFRFIESYDEDYELVFRALYHDNKFRKRDLLINMAKKYARKEILWKPEAWPPEDKVRDVKDEVMNDKLQSFFNIAMHSELEDLDIKARQLIGFLAWYIPDDSLLQRTSRFMSYFANQELDIPNLGDFYSRGQIKSKLWMVTELANIVDGPLGNVVFYGGWYNFLAHFLFDQFEVDKITSIDVDETVVGPCKRLYAEELDDKRFNPFTADVSKLQWRDQKDLWYHDFDKRDEQITEWMEGQEQNLTDKRQVLIDQWIQKQEDSLTVKRQEQIDTWLEKQEAKYAQEIEAKEDNIRQGYTTKEKIREDIFKDKDDVIEKFSVELREELFKDKDTVIEKISEDLRTEMFKDKESIFENYGWRRLDKFDMVVNTSCEHMNDEWFENLPDGTFVVLQTNDYFENEQHSNCCKDMDVVKGKYPMSNIFYEGELDTHLYNRFMLIGIK